MIKASGQLGESKQEFTYPPPAPSCSLEAQLARSGCTIQVSPREGYEGDFVGDVWAALTSDCAQGWAALGALAITSAAGGTGAVMAVQAGYFTAAAIGTSGAAVGYYASGAAGGTPAQIGEAAIGYIDTVSLPRFSGQFVT